MAVIELNEQARFVASCIDHTLLRPDARRDDIITLCEEARAYGFATVCVNPCFVALTASELVGSGVGICTVVGFPLGANLPEVKAFEARAALAAGATELDMVMNISAAKDGAWHLLEDDIRAVVEASTKASAGCDEPVSIKVILECCLLKDHEKIKACEAACKAGAAFVKTSTGFSSGGATIEDVKLMRSSVKACMKVKASGGIRTAADALALLEAGADRLGASAGVAIVQELMSAECAQ